MLTIEIIRRLLTSLLKETTALPPLEKLPAMEPSELAAAMTTAWDLRQRAGELSWHLNDESRSAPENSSLRLAAQASFELYDRLRRYDRCAVDLLSLTRRPVTTCASDLQSAVDAMVETPPALSRECQTSQPPIEL